MKNRVIPLALVTTIIPYACGCHESEAVKPAQVVVASQTASNKSESSILENEALLCYDEHIKYDMARALQLGVTDQDYFWREVAFGNYLFVFQRSKDPVTRALSLGMAIQDKIRLRLAYAEGKQPEEQEFLIREALELGEIFQEYADTMILAGRYDPGVYKKVFDESVRLGIDDPRAVNLEQQLVVLKKQMIIDGLLKDSRIDGPIKERLRYNKSEFGL